MYIIMLSGGDINNILTINNMDTQVKQEIPVSEGTKVMLDTIQNELFPVLEKLKKLLVDVQSCRIRFPLYSPKLNSLEIEYGDISVDFFNVARKLDTPDILFKGLKEDTQNIASYLQFRNVTAEKISDGSRYLEILDRTLDRKKESIINAWTLVLAFLAILVSILTLF